MPQQLLYTSAPRGIVAGRSGYCTVARSALMREALLLQLEKFCYYLHLSLTGGRDRPIFACRLVDIRGARFHVLSRIQDAGLDFTGRTNFLAHHLVFTPEEIRQFPAPPVILRDWPGWVKSWAKEPQLLENEDWTQLIALNARALLPAQNWQRVTGDAINGFGLLEARAPASFRVDDQTDETVLDLFAESLALMEIRDPRRDCRAAAWSYTFTTSLQEQDNPADFRWRCLHADNPAASRYATPDCRLLSAVRALKCSGEEAAFARTGRQLPRFLAEPQDLKITEGDVARFAAQAEGLPAPACQWFAVDRAGNAQPLTGETSPELVVSAPPLGITRYAVRATNVVGEVRSRVARLCVEEKLNAATKGSPGGPRAGKDISFQKSANDIEQQRRRLAVRKEEEDYQNWRRRNKTFVLVLGILVLVLAVLFAWIKYKHPPAARSPGPAIKNEAGAPAAVPAVSSHAPETTMASQPNPAADAGQTADRLLLSQDSVPLPAPWQAESIGWSAKTSAPRYDHGTFLLTAPAGELLPWQTHDAFVFTSRPSSNGVELVARFSMSAKIGFGRCGLMLRASDQPDAPFVFIGSSETSVVWMLRATNGAASTQLDYQTVNQPVYLKLTQQDNQVAGYFSSNGKNWLPLCVNGQIELGGPNHLIGFAACAGMNEKPIHANFDNVTINGLKQ